MNTEDARALAESALDTLAAQLESGHSQSLTAYLAAMGRFHRYSANNILLIHLQRRDATRVAGFSAWRKLGRFVRRGEKGIVILVPLTTRRSNTQASDNIGGDVEEAPTVFGFKPGYVFDVSQTDGEPLPEFAEVTGDPGGYITALKGFVCNRGIELAYANAELGSAHGASLKGRILLRDDLSPAVEFSVLVHEVAHELLHAGDRRATTTKTVRETEAEAVAFVVSHAIGLATSTAASDYIQLYSGDKNTLISSLALIQRAAADILSAIRPDHGDATVRATFDIERSS
jgi:antirestriction protein ArdC